MEDNNERTDESKMTTDRETIRRWAEKHGASPVRSREEGMGTSEYRLMSEQNRSDDVESATWDEFFEDTEANDRTVLYNEQSTRDENRFEILGRDEAERRGAQEVGSGGMDETMGGGTETMGGTRESDDMVGGGETETMESARETDEMMETGDMQSGREMTDTGDMGSARGTDETTGGMESDREMTGTGDRESTGPGDREADEMMDDMEASREMTETGDMEGARETDEMMSGTETDRGTESGRGTTDTDDVESGREIKSDREMEEDRGVSDATGTEGGRGITESGDMGSDREMDEMMGGESTDTVDAESGDRMADDDSIGGEGDVGTPGREPSGVDHAGTAEPAEGDAGTPGTDTGADAGAAGTTTGTGEERAESGGGDVVGSRGPSKGKPPESDVGTDSDAARGSETGPEGRSAPMEDDTGKTVVDASGNEVGMIVEVREGTAYVEPNPSLTSKIKTALGWGEAEEENYPVRREQIARITDDRVELSSTERAR